MKKRYHIHQVSELLGISADAIRLYEKSGLVSSIRSETNGYRYYEAEQIHRIMGISLYRKLDVSIPEIKRIAKISDFSHMIDEFSVLIENNEKHIEELQKKVEKYRFMRQHLSEISQGIGKYSIHTIPERYSLKIGDSDNIEYEKIAEIVSKPIFSFGNVSYFGKYDENNGYVTGSIQFVIRKPMLEICPLTVDMDMYTKAEECECIYTVYPSPETRLFKWNIDEMMTYAENNGYRCKKEAYAFYIYSLMGENEMTDFYEVYLPIEKK